MNSIRVHLVPHAWIENDTIHIQASYKMYSRLRRFLEIESKRVDTNFSKPNDPGFRKPNSLRKKRSVKKGGK